MPTKNKSVLVGTKNVNVRKAFFSALKIEFFIENSGIL